MKIFLKLSLLLCIVFMQTLYGSDDGLGELNQDLTPEQLNGQRLFDSYCSACHAGALPEAPQRAALNLYTPERIADALNSGVMSTQGLLLSGQEIEDVAYYLTGKQVHEGKPEKSLTLCESKLEPLDTTPHPSWTSWGGLINDRHQANETKLTPKSVKKLSLKWAFGFPDTTRARSQPIVTSQAVYVGSQSGKVYALEPSTGCIYWAFDADSEVRGSLQLIKDREGTAKLVFGDFKANVYAIDAITGQRLWKTRAHEHALATITGSVKADTERVYVPVSSSEVVPAAHPSYPCCTFRGALVAVDLASGEILWQAFTTDKPKIMGKNSAGVDQFGPSGAPIWSSPTIDVKRGLIYATTGQNYSSPATGTSDAVLAIDAKTGEVKWVSQVLAGDAWNGACGRKTANCPEENGPDFDLGASAILITTESGKERLLVGQKSGLVFAMDPNQAGKILWQQRVGKGGTMGGVHWGMSTDKKSLFVGVSDLPTNNPNVVGDPHPGVHALDPDTGEFIWRTELPNVCPKDIKFYCFPGVSAAISSSPGLVFAGGLDGMLRALSAESGEILWEYSTFREYNTVNGVKGFGGAIEADGPVVVNGTVYVSSGYDKWGEMPGNVLLVFSLDGE